MANVSRINGFQPVKYDPCQIIRCYHAAGTTVTHDLFVGDPVTFSGTADANGVAGVAIQTAGTNPILGIIVGFEYDPSNPDRVNWIDGASAGYCMVCIDPDAVYEAQVNSASMAITDIGMNVNFVKTQAGSRTTGNSGYEINYTGINTTAALQLKVIGFPQRPDNTPNALYQKALVMINNSLMQGGTGSVGVS